MLPNYELRRSGRRTLSIEINREAKLIVHAPNRMTVTEIEKFIASHLTWIEEKQRIAVGKIRPEPGKSEIAALKEKAAEILTAKTEYYAALMGVSYAHIGITSAKGRFGSCSKKGRINYSWRLMQYPPAAWDYVVVHELCHLTHFDHSPLFWQSVEKYLPDYKERQKLLK